MNEILVAFHNILRWVLFIIGLVAIARALRGWLGNKPYVKQDRLLGVSFTVLFDLQILLGLVLYFLTSSYGLNVFQTQSAGEVMANASFRLFAFEHPLIMLAAAVFAHLGSHRRSRKA
jgi:bacteriorhodopsin